MADYLLGIPYEYVNGGRIPGNRLGIAGHAAAITGTATEFWLYGRANGSIKFGVWDDDTDYPDALLYAENTAQTVVGDAWNVYTLSAGVSIVSGNKYWLGGVADGYGRIGEHVATTGYKYTSATFSTFTCPDPAPSGMTSLNGDTLSFALYGTTGGGPVLTKLMGEDTSTYTNIIHHSATNLIKIIGHDL